MKRALLPLGFVALAIGMAGCSGTSGSATVSSTPTPTVTATNWQPINGYTEADYQDYIAQMNAELSSGSMSDAEKAAFPKVVACAWDRMTKTIPYDEAKALMNNPQAAQNSPAGQQSQQIWAQCNVQIAQQMASAQPSP